MNTLKITRYYPGREAYKTAYKSKRDRQDCVPFFTQDVSKFEKILEMKKKIDTTFHHIFQPLKPLPAWALSGILKREYEFVLSVSCPP